MISHTFVRLNCAIFEKPHGAVCVNCCREIFIDDGLFFDDNFEMLQREINFDRFCFDIWLDWNVDLKIAQSLSPEI